MPIETISWKELGPEFIKAWGRPEGKKDAEHLSIVGPTGSGKSKFQTEVVMKRAEMRGSAIAIIVTKPADSTLKKTGIPIVREYPPEWDKFHKFILWPKSSKNAGEAQMTQTIQIAKFLTDIWEEDANRIVVFDEIAYIEQELRLKILISRYWREARSLGITIVANTQRPRNVSRYMWSEPGWIAAFRPPDEDEARRVAEIIGGRRRYTDVLFGLDTYQFVLINRRTREAYISKIGT